jgi:hypothetical protein
MTGGPGVCTEHVTYVYPANGGKPQVTMTRSGNACGPLSSTGPRGVMQAVPRQRPPSLRPEVPPPELPSAQPSGPHLWTVSDPPQQITTGGTPRS